MLELINPKERERGREGENEGIKSRRGVARAERERERAKLQNHAPPLWSTRYAARSLAHPIDNVASHENNPNVLFAQQQPATFHK